MLDHDHGDAEVLLDVLDPEAHAFRLLDIQARGRFVQQQQFRLDAQRAAKFHDLAHAIGQIGDQRVAIALQAEEGDHVLDLFAMLQLIPPRASAGTAIAAGITPTVRVAMAADQQILQQGGLGKQLDVLKGPCDPKAGDAVRRNVGDVLVFQKQPARCRADRSG